MIDRVKIILVAIFAVFTMCVGSEAAHAQTDAPPNNIQPTDEVQPFALDFSQIPARPRPRKPRPRPIFDSLPPIKYTTQAYLPPPFAQPSILYPTQPTARPTRIDIVPAEPRYAASSLPFYALFALLAGLTIVVNTNRSYFYTLISNISDHRFANNSSQEQLFKGSLSAFFFDILFFIATSLLTYRLLDFYKIPLYIGEKLLTVFEILIILLIFYVLKNVFYRFFGYLFGIKKEISQYLYQISGFNRVSGIALVPLLFLSFYSQSQSYAIILLLMLGILFTAFLLRYIRGIRIAAHIIQANPFYCLIFLIGIEILPILCIIKTLIT